jgi:hypothetical protein
MNRDEKGVLARSIIVKIKQQMLNLINKDYIS